MKLFTPLLVLMLALAACGGESEFVEMDAEGLSGVVDAALTEESGLKGLITADAFNQTDVDEFNEIAKEACDDLSDGISAEDYDEFEAGVLDGASDIGDMIDTEALSRALVSASCPSYLGNLEDAIAG